MAFRMALRAAQRSARNFSTLVAARPAAATARGNSLAAFTPAVASLHTTATSLTPMVTQPAPAFTGTALVNGTEFKDISLDDYKGKVRQQPMGECNLLLFVCEFLSPLFFFFFFFSQPCSPSYSLS